MLGAMALAQTMRHLLFGVGPLDPRRLRRRRTRAADGRGARLLFCRPDAPQNWIRSPPYGKTRTCLGSAASASTDTDHSLNGLILND